MITGEITSQNYELIRDKIGEIITAELAKQYTYTTNSLFQASVYIERIIKIESGEMPVVNVNMNDGLFEPFDLKRDKGTYTYNIDVYVSASHNDTDQADTLSMIKLQKLVGVIRTILRNEVYKTLSFQRGFIGGVKVNSINFAVRNDADLLHNTMARLVFEVVAMEDSELAQVVELGGSDATIKLNETDKGYKFTYDAP